MVGGRRAAVVGGGKGAPTREETQVKQKDEMLPLAPRTRRRRAIESRRELVSRSGRHHDFPMSYSRKQTLRQFAANRLKI